MELKPIKAPDCDGGTNIYGFYNSKKLYLSDGYEKLAELTVQEAVSRVFDHGTGTEYAERLMTVPPVKRMVKEVLATLIPKYKEGDKVMFFQELHRVKPKVTFGTVGKVKGWSAVCSKNGGPKEYMCERELHLGLATSTVNEKNLEKAESYEKIGLAEKLVKKFQREIRKAGIVDAVVCTGGNAYEVVG